MVRVKRGVISNKTRSNVLKKAKGYRFGRSKKEIEASVAVTKAGVYAFTHRKDKKADMRRLWQIRIGAEAKKLGISFSKLIGNLKKANIELDRKSLATLAKDNKEIFAKIVEMAK